VYDILYLVFALTMTLNHYTTVSQSASYQHYQSAHRAHGVHCGLLLQWS